MIPSRHSDASKPNPHLETPKRRKNEANSKWLSRALKDEKPNGWVCLIGGAGVTDFRLRVAQSDVRSDLLPAFWSHAAVITDAKSSSPKDWLLHEVQLEPPSGFQNLAANNGVREERLGRYDDPKAYPNFAAINFHIDVKKIRSAVKSFRNQRGFIDVPPLMIEWLAFAWGAGDRANPLLRQVGMPSAAFVEGVFAIAGLELTPGLSSQSSCPEAIWQAAKWWHDFYASEAMAVEEAPTGFCVIGQEAAAVTFSPRN